MTDGEVYALLQDVFNKVFNRSDIRVTPQLTAADVIGWDSLKQFDIIMEIEDRLRVEISGSKLDALQNVNDLAKLVKSEAQSK